MVTITSLWLPILIAGVLTWIASAIVWMALPHHKSDYKRLPDEEAARGALKGLAPGDYNIPHCENWDEMKSAEGKRRFTDGPVGLLTILPNGLPNMARNLPLQFLYFLLVAVAVAYVTGRALAPGADYLTVFRTAGMVAWLGYSWATIPEAIWYGRPWAVVGKHMADGLFYALLAAGAFAGFWPTA